MAIDKKLIHFKRKSVFNEKLAKNEILDTSIVFIKDTQEIWTHGQLYKCTDTDTNTTYSAGTGLSLSGTTFSHEDTNPNISTDTNYGPTANVTQSAKNTASFKVPQITLDQFGHVKSVSERTITVTDTNTDTHYSTGIRAGASGTITNGSITNPFIKVVDNATYRDQIQLKGEGTVSIESDASGVIHIVGSSHPTSLKNPNALTFGSKSYDGSSAQEITAADLGLASALKYCGVTTTALSDGSTTNPIKINNFDHTSVAGCVVFYGSKEFVFDGTTWKELGDGSNHKIKQSAVSDPNPNGNSTTFIDTIFQDENGKITVTKKNVNFPTTVENANYADTSSRATSAGYADNAGTLEGKSASYFDTAPYSTQRDFVNGTLIETDIPYNVSGDPFYVEIKGNTYSDLGSMFLTAQGYIYNDTIINYSVNSIGNIYPDRFIAVRLNGNLCFWFPRIGYWHGYSVKVTTGYNYTINRVINVTDSAEPNGDKKVNLSEYFYKALNNNNSIVTGGGSSAGSSLTVNLGGQSATLTIPTSIPYADTAGSVYESSIKFGNTNIAGDVTPIDMAMSSKHNPNRLAFGNPNGVTIEYSRDGGATWTDYGATAQQKLALYSGQTHAFYAGNRTANTSLQDRLRITLNAREMGVYTNPKKLLLNVSISGTSGATMLMERARVGSNTSFESYGTYDIQGQSGWNSIPLNWGTFGGGENQGDNWSVMRLTFTPTGYYPGYEDQGFFHVMDIALHGSTDWSTPSEMARTGHIYSYDVNQNVTFPNQVTVNGGLRLGSSTSDAGTQKTKIYFGDGDYCWIGECHPDGNEDHDDAFSIHGSYVFIGDINNEKYIRIYGGSVSAPGGFFETSDARLKEFLVPINVDLDKLSKLTKSYFIWKNKTNTEREIGVSAQEIQEIYPELVSKTEDGHLNVSYSKLSVVALAAIDQLHDENKKMKNKINTLEERLAKLESLLER